MARILQRFAGFFMADENYQMLVNALRAGEYNFLGRGSLGGFDRGFSPDGKHNKAWQSYGYCETLTFTDYYNMYSRSGMAKRFVELAPKETWSEMPIIAVDPKDPDDPLWLEVQELDEVIGLRRICEQLDIAQSVGKYGGILMELKDGGRLNTPAGKVPIIDGIQSCKVLFEDQLDPVAWNQDETSPEYLKPTMFQLQERTQSGNNPDGGRATQVHASRVVIWSEGQSSPNDIYGKSCLEAPFNSLVTLEKIIGAGGEGFWKAARGFTRYHLRDGVKLDALKAQYGEGLSNEEFKVLFNKAKAEANAGFDAAELVSGMDAETVSIDLPDGETAFQNAAVDVATARDYPATIYMGMQTGRLASSEDQKQLGKQVKTRQAGFATPALRLMIDAFMSVGVLTPRARYKIRWPEMFAPTMEQRTIVYKNIMDSFKGSGITPDPGKVAQIAEMDSDKIELFTDIDSLSMDDGLGGE